MVLYKEKEEHNKCTLETFFFFDRCELTLYLHTMSQRRDTNNTIAKSELRVSQTHGLHYIATPEAERPDTQTWRLLRNLAFPGAVASQRKSEIVRTF